MYHRQRAVHNNKTIEFSFNIILVIKLVSTPCYSLLRLLHDGNITNKIILQALLKKISMQL